MTDENKIYISTHTGLEIDRAISLTELLDDRLTAQEDATILHTSQIENLQNSLILEEEIDNKIKEAIDAAIYDMMGGSY